MTCEDPLQHKNNNMEITRRLTLFEAVLKSMNFSKSYNIKGRARRSEFWYTSLACFLASIFFDACSYVLSDILNADEMLCILPISACAYMYIVNFSCLCRRMHDIGKSCILPFTALALACSGVVISLIAQKYTSYSVLNIGRLLFLSVSILVSFYIVYLCTKDSEKGKNRYGYSDKYVDPNDNPALTERFWKEYGNIGLPKR